MNGAENFVALILVTLLSAVIPEIAFGARNLGVSVLHRIVAD
jgi:hypothetical protein